jgi:hypothetical protein
LTVWADYSFARPDLAQLKAEGVVGVFRYLSPDDQNTHGKILFPPEKNMLLAAGFDITLNFEWYQGRCNEGANAGMADGATALAQAKALGYPEGKCIYFSHDTGTYNWAQIESYFRAVKTALGGYYKIGCYGSYDLCTHLESQGLVDHSWQTLAWSGGQRDPKAVIYQNGVQLQGGAADVDIVTSTDISSWLDGPAPTKDWFDMATAADLQKVIDERLVFILPRLAGLLRTGNGNIVFTPANVGTLIDHVGIDGEIEALKEEIASLKATQATGVDYVALAKAVADELHSRLES